MKINNQYKYILTDRFGEIEVDVLNESDFEIEFDKQKEYKNFFVQKLNQNVIFKGAIYQRLKALEKSNYIFDVLKLQIIDQCEEGIDVVILESEILLTDGSWNETLCTVAFKIGNENPDKCLKKREKEKINLLAEISTKVVVQTNTVGGGVYEYKTCSLSGSVQIPSQYGNLLWCGVGNPFQNNWLLFRHLEQKSQLILDEFGNPIYFHTTTWVREIVEVDCSEPIQSDWILIENNCATLNTKKYGKKALLFNEVFIQNYTSPNEFLNDFKIKVLGSSPTTVVEIDNGMKLNDIIQKFVNKFCPELEVVSDFFQINPENPSSINYFTGQTNFVNNIIVFQKADVKRPNAVNNSTKAEWTFDKLIETLHRMFFVKYSIEGNIFRLEHGSYFSKEQGLDLTQPQFKKFVNEKLKYDYDFNDVPTKEIFAFAEVGQDEKWNANLNYYGNDVRGKIEEKKYQIEDVTTDVQFVLDNPNPNNDLVKDDGFVFVATRFSGSKYYIITETTNEGVRLNNSLSFPQLIKRYGNFERFGKQATLNGGQISFTSIKPFKKGEELSIVVCCKNEFNPMDFVLTELGKGFVDKASWRLKTKVLKLSLVYDIYEDQILVINFPTIPLTTQKNQPISFNVLATIGFGTIDQYDIKVNALFGIVVKTGFDSFEYTPNSNFVGSDSFIIRAVSNISSVFQDTVFNVFVLNSGVSIYAEDDNFIVPYGINFVSASITKNDVSVDGVKNVITNSVTSANGVLVSISADGIFNYQNNSNVGLDSFQYTIENSTSEQATAIVNLNVVFPSQPIAIDDEYQTEKNTTLLIDGTMGFEKLQSNDITLDGLPYIFEVIPETKSTVESGSVDIFANGLFEYNPPVDFVGQDSFQYTVYTSNGSSSGNVTINVFPKIYVQLIRQTPVEENVYISCSGSQQFIGIKKTSDYIAKFYSDAGGTIPIDVTGFGIRLKFRIEAVSGLSAVNYQISEELVGLQMNVLNLEYETPIGTCGNPSIGTQILNVTIDNLTEI